MTEGDALAREIDRLVRQVSGWLPSRWASPAEVGGPARAEIVAGLVADLAELGRLARTGAPPDARPAVVGPHALAAQVVVLAGDLVDAGRRPDAAGDPVAAVAAATERVRLARRRLDGR